MAGPQNVPTRASLQCTSTRGADVQRFRRTGRRLAGWCVTALVLVFLGACATTEVGIEGFESVSISIVESGVQGAALDLDGSQVSGEVTVVVDAKPTPDLVRLYLDDAERAGAPLATDDQAPFTFVLDTTKLANGEHVLDAVIEATRGKRTHTRIESATFVVSNPTAEEPAPEDGAGGGEDPVEASVTSVQIAEGDASIEVGQTLALTAVVETTGDADATVAWTSSNGTVEIDANGVVTALAEGAALVTATSVFDVTKSATVSVTVWAPAGSEPVETGSLALRGDPSFSEAQLSSEARMWYRRMWMAIDHPDQDPDAAGLANSANTYLYGRTLNDYMTMLLVAFRVTGDLRILDEVDRLTQMMRGHLRTTFVTAEGDASTPDDPSHPHAFDPTDGTAGIRRWLQIQSDDFYGTDTHMMDDMLTHSLVATFAYAFHNNRDLASPAGVDYAERAAFWLSYLENDFERKWRMRKDVPTGFPFLWHEIIHPHTHFIRYHHYMHLMTGDDGYRVEAERMVAMLMESQVECATPQGTGYLWTHGLQPISPKNNFLQPTVYIGLDITARYDLALEGVSPSVGPEHMQRLVNSLASFVYDGDPAGTGEPYAGTIGGHQQERCGVPYLEWGSRTERRSHNTARDFAALVIWDDSGQVRSMLDAAFESLEWDADNPRRIEIPIGNLILAGS